MRRSLFPWVTIFVLFSVTTSGATSFRCAESEPTVPINPGCFLSFDPPSDGTCTSNLSQFLLQAIVPNVDVPHQVKRFGFWSNDGTTVFPSAGVLVSTLELDGTLRLPSSVELTALQRHDISSGSDTSQAWIDLSAENLLVPPGAETVLLLVVQLPASGTLSQVGTGPGILADVALPDQDCDFFSLDGGATWQAPFYIPEDPASEPLDWGFEVELEPATATTKLSWAQVKLLYRQP